MSDIKTISNKNLRELVSLHFPSNQKDPTTDRDYAYLDLDWVENEAYQGYKHWMSLFNFGRGINNSDWKANFDCEDLANSFKTYLKLLHAEANPYTLSERAKGKVNIVDTESVLVGTIFYKNSVSSAHSINVFFDNSKQGEVYGSPKFFEPMYGKFINLNKNEQESTWYVEF